MTSAADKKRQRIIDGLIEKFKGRTMSPYGIAILEDVEDILPEDTPQIEEVMRTQHSTLDHLDHPTFRKLARMAWRVVRDLRQDRTYETPAYPYEVPPEPEGGNGDYIMTTRIFQALTREVRALWHHDHGISIGTPHPQ